MLDLLILRENTWTPAELDSSIIVSCFEEAQASYALEYLAIFQIEPFIDALLVRKEENSSEIRIEKRFTFHEGFSWGDDDELFFRDNCLHNPRLDFTHAAMDVIFNYYSAHYSDWKIQRYYTKPMRLLDHIYNCMRMGTAKEILYKAGLDELADNIDTLDELNLLSSKPTELYEGVPMRVLRALNCKEGAHLLSKEAYRNFLIELNRKFPGIFKEKLNDAQCKYLMFLIDGNLTVGESGRLFNARRLDLMTIWTDSQFDMFMWKDKLNQQVLEDIKCLAKIDPLYKVVTDDFDYKDLYEASSELKMLTYYLLYNRDEYDKLVRKSNRKRAYDWQERSYGYVVRYPQTANDFCREATYMSNCLLTYVEAFIHNDTNILFIRRNEDVNKPFITMEIYEGELMQAYHRFNEDCTYEEAKWIRAYCDRHGIGHSKFKFDKNLDQLF